MRPTFVAVLLAIVSLGATPSQSLADACSESATSCSTVLETASCQADCAGECWSIAANCTHDGAVPVDGVCDCVAPGASCRIAHGRIMAKLYRLAAQAHKRCIKRADDAGADCPDPQALEAIERAQRVAQRRARRACGGQPSGTTQVELANELLGCLQAGDEYLPCRRVIARQSLRHASVVSRSTAQCLVATFSADGGARRCPREEWSDAITESLTRRNDRIAAVCNSTRLLELPGTCSLAQCDRSLDGVAYRPDACAECCADQTAAASLAAAFAELPLHCGDGIHSEGEQCDDGNNENGDGCDDGCRSETATQDPACPNVEEMFFYAGVYGACASNADCPAGTCDNTLQRCRTATDFDRGWTGISHDQDWNHGQSRRLALHCPLDDEPGCANCEVLGLAPLAGECRCKNDTRIHCDEPFAADQDDCGGAQCQCYAGPPVPFSAGNWPSCIVERYDEDPSGTIDVDSGERRVTIRTKVDSFGGETLTTPCPYCDGDTAAGDGLRDGVCVYGDHAGLSCDSDARNETFPAPGSGATSLDCFPPAGKNGSGSGLKINWTQTTGTAVLEPSREWSCGFPPFLVLDSCHCGLCDNDASVACSSHSDCFDGGLCAALGGGSPLPNQCAQDSRCLVGIDGEGTCELGPIDKLCDGILRADGRGFIACLSNTDCALDTLGIDAGVCSLEQTRKCFPERVERIGRADASNPVLAAITCLPVESNAGRNAVHGQPGPAARRWEATATFWCADNPETEYIPNVGGCR